MGFHKPTVQGLEWDIGNGYSQKCKLLDVIVGLLHVL